MTTFINIFLPSLIMAVWVSVTNVPEIVVDTTTHVDNEMATAAIVVAKTCAAAPPFLSSFEYHKLITEVYDAHINTTPEGKNLVFNPSLFPPVFHHSVFPPLVYSYSVLGTATPMHIPTDPISICLVIFKCLSLYFTPFIPSEPLYISFTLSYLFYYLWLFLFLPFTT